MRCGTCSRTDGRFHTSVCGAAGYALDVSCSSTFSTLVGANDTNDFIPGWNNCSISWGKLDPSPELFASFGDGAAAYSAARGLSLSNGASNHGGSVGAPLASLGDGNIQPRSLGATRPGSLDAHSSWNVSTSQRGGVSGAKVPGDGGGTSGATRGLHEGAGGHGDTAAQSERLSPRSATSAKKLARSAQRARVRSCTAVAYLARLSQRVAATALRRELYADRTTMMIHVSFAFGMRGACSAIVSHRVTAGSLRV